MDNQPEKKRIKEGWWQPINSRRFHFFVDGRSLCGSWMFPDYSEMEADTGDNKPTSQDCKSCFEKLLKRRTYKKIEQL